MQHHIIYWEMAKRETDVDDVELAALRHAEGRCDAYIEFLDGRRVPHAWDHGTHVWRVVPQQRGAVAA